MTTLLTGRVLAEDGDEIAALLTATVVRTYNLSRKWGGSCLAVLSKRFSVLPTVIFGQALGVGYLTIVGQRWDLIV